MTSMSRGWRAVRRASGRSAGLLLGTGVVAGVVGGLVLGLIPGSPARPARADNVWQRTQVQQSTVLPAFSLRVDLLALQRHSPEVAVGVFRVTNIGSAEQHLGLVLGTHDDVSSASGFALLSASERKAYLPLHARDGGCVCSLFPPGSDPTLAPGAATGVFVWFPVPRHAHTLSVLVPHAPPLLDVRLAEGAQPVPAPSGQPPRDPASLSLRPPQIEDLVAVADDTETSTVTEDQGDETRIRLAADVLFEINKADLTPRARTVLEDVAARLERLDAGTVNVDGHTDVTGSDEINIPLSERRARTVKEALERMVDRPIRYDVEGHGSARPVAPNDTEEGRRLNRRVTVTFRP